MTAYALELLAAGSVFEILAYEHPDFSLYVSFDDEIATECDEGIDRLVDEISDVPNVDRAIREDREVVLVGGTISAPALEEWLANWWRTWLRQTRPSDRD